MFRKYRLGELVCGLVVGLCGSFGAWAQDEAAEILAELKAKAGTVESWRAEHKDIRYNPETGETWSDTSGVFQTRAGAVAFVQTDAEREYSSRNFLDENRISWTENRYKNFRGDTTETVYKTDTAQIPGLYEQTPGLIVFLGFLPAHQTLLGSLPKLYSIWEEAYTWEVLEKESDTVSLRGSLKEELMERWAADPAVEFYVIGAVELTAQPDTGLPVRIRIFDHEKRLRSEDVFENIEADVDIDPSLFQPSITVSDGVKFIDGTERFKEKTQAMIAGKYTAFVEAQRAARQLTVKVGENIADLAGPGVDGSTVALADYAGKVVLIDFWATWCGPCVADMPNVLENYERYREQGFEVLAISLDDDISLVTDFVEENPGYTWAQICDTDAWESELVKRFNIQGIPTTILVDGEGVVLAVKLRGEALDEKLAEVFGESTD